VAAHRNGSGAHGKEGVDGSSPSEGFNDSVQMGLRDSRCSGLRQRSHQVAGAQAVRSDPSLCEPRHSDGLWRISSRSGAVGDYFRAARARPAP
jgi:hypothetical protein